MTRPQRTRPRPIFLVSDRSCPKTDGLRPHHRQTDRIGKTILRSAYIGMPTRDATAHRHTKNSLVIHFLMFSECSGKWNTKQTTNSRILLLCWFVCLLVSVEQGRVLKQFHGTKLVLCCQPTVMSLWWNSAQFHPSQRNQLQLSRIHVRNVYNSYSKTTTT